ncbi:hypothetical protein D3C78_1838920 [compost metagenome]
MCANNLLWIVGLIGCPKNIVSLIFHDLPFAFVCGGAFGHRRYTALNGHPLDVTDTVHRAVTFSKVGLDQLIGEVAGA